MRFSRFSSLDLAVHNLYCRDTFCLGKVIHELDDTDIEKIKEF